MRDTHKRELDGLVHDLTARRGDELLTKGVRFQARASRRVTTKGLRYLLLLQVWPEDGFDNFEWDAFHRPWVGRPTGVNDAVAKANSALDAYARGERPPGPAFSE